MAYLVDGAPRQGFTTQAGTAQRVYELLGGDEGYRERLVEQQREAEYYRHQQYAARIRVDRQSLAGDAWLGDGSSAFEKKRVNKIPPKSFNQLMFESMKLDAKGVK